MCLDLVTNFKRYVKEENHGHKLGMLIVIHSIYNIEYIVYDTQYKLYSIQ